MRNELQYQHVFLFINAGIGTIDSHCKGNGPTPRTFTVVVDLEFRQISSRINLLHCTSSDGSCTAKWENNH